MEFEVHANVPADHPTGRWTLVFDTTDHIRPYRGSSFTLWVG